MSEKKSIIYRYAEFLSHHPFIVLFIALIITGFAVYYAQNVKTQSVDYKTMLPQDLEVMKGMNILDDEYGGSDSVLFLVELDPSRSNSSIEDIRDPKVIKYMYLLGEMAKHTDYVSQVRSGATLLKEMNGGVLPKSLNKIKKMTESNEMFDYYFSKDRKMALVKINLEAGYDEMKIVKDLEGALCSVPKPYGVKAELAGTVVSHPIIRQKLKPDMAKTSRFSMLGIILILYLLFRSVKYSLIPLSTIAIGMVWAFGYIGLVGMGISSATSGVMSMIMGIGIDFGIQTASRFRQELKKSKGKHKVEDAMKITLSRVIVPMATTTLAALIGFKAMSMGEITVMEELGKMMSYGITACFLTSITVVPSLLIIFEKYTLGGWLKWKK